MAVSKAKKTPAGQPKERPAEERFVQKHPAAALPIPGEPPPILRNYNGADELSYLHPSHDVHLDYACFMWLWRMVEAKALTHYNSVTTKMVAPEQVEVALRTVQSFREAAGTVKSKAATVGKVKTRTMTRR